MPLGAVPFPFGICRICRDKATGLHYGVATCEGCKGFFKRSIAKGDSFKCHFGGSCDVTPKTRSHCKACRFKRCMETGMSVEGVRMGRVPKTEKDKVLEAFQDGGSNFSHHELVLQRLGSGNYKFELNKTLAGTTSTCTSATDSVSNTTAAEALEKNIGKGNAVEDFSKVLGYGISSRTDKSVSNAGTDVTECEEKSTCGMKEQDCNDTSTSAIVNKKLRKTEMDQLNVTNSLCKVSAPNLFTAMNENIHGEDYSLIKQTATCSVKDETASEKCDNPFDDVYIVKTALQGQENVIGRPRQRYPAAEHPWQNLMSITNAQHIDGIAQDEDGKALPYNTQGAISRYKDTRNNMPQHRKHFEPYIKPHVVSHRESGVPQGDSTRRNATHTQSSDCRTRNSCATMPLASADSDDCSYDTDEHDLRRRNSFSPGLINVLLEQVLDSNEAVHVIAEKIQQKQRQGNFSESFAQTLSQHISNLSAKRRRTSEDDIPDQCQVEHDLNSAHSHRVHTDSDTIRNKTDLNKSAVYTHFQTAVNAAETSPNFSSSSSQRYDSNTYSSNGRVTMTMDPRSGHPLYRNSNNPVSREGVMVSSGIVSSSITSEEEESKIQQIKSTLDGITIGMKILNRLKPEHREKIRQYKLGKLNVRVMTNSEEDVKETYTKLINGIANLNERILGFCNSVPGFSDIAKEDRDVLMKRAYYDIWMLCYSEYFHGQESYMLLETGEFYSEQAMRKILNDDMVNQIFLFANQFNDLELTDSETAILCAVRLTCSDELELLDRSKVSKLHSHMLDVFAFEVEKNHETTHARKLIDTFRLMPLLEVVNRIQREIIAKYSI